MRSVLCVGHAAFDTIYRVTALPREPTKVRALDFAESGGGMAANASVAVSRLGGRAAYWGRVGDDARGERIVAELAADGVDVSNVRRQGGAATSCAAILVDDDGERLVCSYNDSTLDADAGWLPLPQVAAFDAVLVDVRWPEASVAVLRAAREAGRFAVLDADVGPTDVLRRLPEHAGHTVYSYAGLALAAGIDAPGAALRRVSAPGRFVGVTLGADGFLWLDGTTERRIAAPTIRAVDTLAAGDVWHAAFALALAEGGGIEACARFANVAAAIKCTRFGGRRGCPSRAEVEKYLTINSLG
jgi:sulfofructose kinase